MNRKRFFTLAVWFSIVVSIVAGCQPTNQIVSSTTITVSAASSLNDAFQELGKQWEQETGNKITFSFGSTGQLAQQIERGASPDLFVAADRQQIEALDQKALIQSNTKKLYGRGRLVIWTKQDSPLTIKDLKDLTRSEVKRIAIASLDRAPYGVAAKQALESLGIWQAVQPKLVFAENIRQAQQYAETGNVDVALTALSLSVKKPGKWQLVAENLHQPLDQMMAVPKSAKHPEQGKLFADFINSQKGRPTMQKYGFVLPGASVAKE
ncbi:MAG: molybdate ABC transporter substrate-binding protein [Plectolyngbya sp. WJT66-NPBG17]|jgi:molybdate transport system substrate-binding protein|nr:molybdate ABC transporter substrate-binding protein [Plectolyngbya sp. WJT66-NPBG17]